MGLIVRIQQHEFPITREYQAGHPLTEGEAAALNQMLVENIRNNVYGWVPPGAVLTADEEASIRLRIELYARGYVFKTKTRAKPPSILDSHAREIAIQQAEAWGQQNGYAPESAQVMAKFNELKKSSIIMDRARELIRVRAGVINEQHEDDA